MRVYSLTTLKPLDNRSKDDEDQNTVEPEIHMERKAKETTCLDKLQELVYVLLTSLVKYFVNLLKLCCRLT